MSVALSESCCPCPWACLSVSVPYPCTCVHVCQFPYGAMKFMSEMERILTRTHTHTHLLPLPPSLRQFCLVPVWSNSSCFRQFLKQDDSRGAKRCAKTQHGFSWPGIPTFLNLAWLVPHPPPPTSCDGRKRVYCPFRNRKKPGAFSLHRNLPRGRSMTAPHMELDPNLLVPSS
jgi:hypothetical protein